MHNIIIAMSGRKQAGKNTIGNELRKFYAKKLTGDGDVDKHTAECSFADSLKEFCIDTLGLSRESCYGTDDEKNSPTHYLWENVPRFLAWKFGDPFAKKNIVDGKTQDELMDIYFNQKDRKYATGNMTGREVMQLFGTDLIRESFGNCWAMSTIRRINKNGKLLSVITDNRFPNEIDAVLSQPNGYVIRLTRSPFGTKDSHPSESSLDDFDWSRERCHVIDNASMTMEEQLWEAEIVLNSILIHSCLNQKGD